MAHEFEDESLCIIKILKESAFLKWKPGFLVIYIVWLGTQDGLVWFVGFYGISTFVGYLTPNPFLCI